jgi:ketosteroid isomerase-like protein
MTADESAVRRWLADWQALINRGDIATARGMFAGHVTGYGTLMEATAGLDALARDQWGQVWPRIRAFTFDPPDLIRIDGDLALVALRWHSLGVAADGTDFARRGRATLVFDRHGSDWRCCHSHLSMAPGTEALR